LLYTSNKEKRVKGAYKVGKHVRDTTFVVPKVRLFSNNKHLLY